MNKKITTHIVYEKLPRGVEYRKDKKILKSRLPEGCEVTWKLCSTNYRANEEECIGINIIIDYDRELTKDEHEEIDSVIREYYYNRRYQHVYFNWYYRIKVYINKGVYEVYFEDTFYKETEYFSEISNICDEIMAKYPKKYYKEYKNFGGYEC